MVPFAWLIPTLVMRQPEPLQRESIVVRTTVRLTR